MNWKDLDKKNKLYIFLFGGIALLLIWTFISAGIITHDFNRGQLSGDKDKQEAFINGIILTETKNSKKYWEIYAETGQYNSNNEIAILNYVVGNFYDENNGEVTMSFQSTKGSYDSPKGIIDLDGDVLIVLKSGITLRSDTFRYAGQDKVIVAKGHVHITKDKDFLATSDEVEISPDFEKIKIKGHASSKIFKNRS